LVILNLGLYVRLASQQIEPAYTFPYSEDFSALSTVPYEEFGGDWEIRDAMLVQLSTSGYDLMAFVPIELPAEQPYAFETTLRYLGGSMGGGVMFNAQQVTSRQKSHMARFNVDAGQLWLIYGYFGDDSNFVGQGSFQTSIAPDDANPHRLRVQVEGGKYALFVDDVQAAADVPLQYQGGAVGLISATSQIAFDDVSIGTDLKPLVPAQTVPLETPPEALPTPELTTALVMSDSFESSGGDSLWLPISGTWVASNGAYIQQQTNGFELSAVYQQAFTYPLTLTAEFQHQQGAGGGILFNLGNVNSTNGGYMVRYMGAGDEVAWGYFDQNGVFNGQGGTNVPLPEQGVHTLAVSTDGTAYNVALDGTTLVSGVPLVNPLSSGYIGLTASQSAVAFNQVTVSGAQAAVQPAGEFATADIDAERATGTWIDENGAITQSASELTDYIAGTGLAGERFSISADIALPADNPDAGAGIIFHMDGRDDRRLGHMVRFGSGGKELFWGHYDAEGIFVGEGGIPLSSEAAGRYALKLVVLGDTFEIVVNGETIVEAIPIQRSSGWIGLISFSGPVTFSNVSLKLGE
jgi:hypothetical protein